jgi:hypothetical protein
MNLTPRCPSSKSNVLYFTILVSFSLEELDNRRLRIWKGSHPKRYQEPSVATMSVRSYRSRSTSIAPASLKNTLSVKHSKRNSLNGRLDGQSMRSGVDSAMSNKHREITAHLRRLEHNGTPLIHNGELTDKAKREIKGILKENDLYSDVLDEINKRLRLQRACVNASDAVSSNHMPSIHGGSRGSKRSDFHAYTAPKLASVQPDGDPK